MSSVPDTSLLFAGYVVAFGAAALVCFGGLVRVRRVEDEETRRGLAALLLTSGGWAAAHVGFLVAPGAGLKEAFYLFGLVVGFSTLGPWLYLCSAYTGRTLHRDPTYRRLAVALFVGVVAVKVTNPVHGRYFATELVASPFPHLAVTNLTLHWVAMGLAYVLAGVGYFMLFEHFRQVGYGTRPLGVLVAITGSPVVLDVLGSATPWLIDITYEPLGVAAFAGGVLFVFLDQFQAVRLAGTVGDPVVVLDGDGRVQDYNEEALDLFPGLEAATGERLEAHVPWLAEHIESDEEVLEHGSGGATRYYMVSTNPFTFGRREVGELVTVNDVTESEQYRRKLEQQNERLERFASVVSHDLRNPLNVASGRVELERERRDSDHLDAAAEAHERMAELIDDLLALAREGQDIDEPEPASLAALAEDSWENVEAPDATLRVDADLAFRADPERTRQLLENLFRNAVEHAGDAVTVGVGPLGDDGFYVEDDGPGIPPDRRERVFEPGHTTAEDGTGFGLAIVGEIANAHGWSVDVAEGRDGGARFEVTGVTAERAESAPARGGD